MREAGHKAAKTDIDAGEVEEGHLIVARLPGDDMTPVLRSLSLHECLTVEAIAKAALIPNHRVVSAAGRLIKRGYVTRAERGCFTLTEEGEAFRKSGARITSGPTIRPGQKPHVRTASLTERVWTALRITGKASTPDIIGLSCTDPDRQAEAIRVYLSRLRKAGYLRDLRREPGTAPSSPGFKRFALIRDTGPAAPRWQKRENAMFDPNTGETHPFQVEAS